MSKAAEAPVTADSAQKTHTDAQGGLHDTTARKSENNKEDSKSTLGDLPHKAGCSYLETNSGDNLVQPTSNQTVNSNEARKKNFQPGNKEIHIFTADSSSHTCEISLVDSKDARTKFSEKPDVSCLSNNCSTTGNTSFNLDYQKDDPVSPEVKNTNLAMNSEELKENKGKKNNDQNTNIPQDFALPAGTHASGLMTMATEDIIAGKCIGLRVKQNQNEVIMTTSSRVSNVKTTENENANVDSTIENEKRLVQPGSFEEKGTENVATLLGSCMSDSNKLSSTCESLMPLEGGKVNANFKTNRLLSTTQEKDCQIAAVEGFTKPSAAVPVSGIHESADTYTLGCQPHENQKNQLGPIDGGSNLFQIGNRASNNGENVHPTTNIHELDTMTNSDYEFRRSYLDPISSKGNKLQEKEITCLSTDHNVNCISPSSLAHAYNEKLRIAFSPTQSLPQFRKKKLLILDLNGLLADINQDYHNAHMAHAKIQRKLVFRRPYCDDFLYFCIRNFELGIWSSRKRGNVDSVVDILMRDLKPYLRFSWDLSKCTVTGVKTLENRHKPLVLKELSKLWDKEEPGLPWEKGEFSPSNTLLVDDSPYKALRNPPYTAIFPYPYSYLNLNDNSLGPGGDLRVYLENLAIADNVEWFVGNYPFGQPFITQSDPNWNFYAQVAGESYSSLARRA